jgi:diguanylate cyclase (GGDEF)-like protein/PAS domain S-box-containing protein
MPGLLIVDDEEFIVPRRFTMSQWMGWYQGGGSTDRVGPVPGKSMIAYRGKLLHHVILPIALLVALSMGVVVAFIWFSARTQDEVALSQSVETVRDAIDRQLAQIGLAATDYTWWDEAVANLDVVLNENWADNNVGFYIHQVHGYELSLVIDRANQTIYEQVDGERQPELDAFDVLTPELHVLVEQARAAPIEEPQPATGLLRFGDGLVLVGASAVTPQEPGDASTSDRRRVVVVFAKKVTEEFLQSIGAPLPLTDLRLAPPGIALQTAAFLPLLAPKGDLLGYLNWQPHQPGRAFLRAIAPALAIAILVIAAFTYAVLRHARETTNAMEASESRFRDVADASSDWIWEVDAALRLTFISERYALVTGRPPAASLGMPIAGLFHPGESPDRWRRYLDDLQHWHPFRDVVSLCEDANGINRTVRLAGKPVLDASGKAIGYRGTATDITAEIEAGRRAEYLAMHDPLTGLPNRVLLLERLEQAIASVSRRRDMAALLLIDLDRFKDINDTLGHPAGDLLLQQVAVRLSACVREVDTVARIGGDEFSLVLVGIKDAADAQLLSRRLLETFQTPFDLSGHEVLVTISVGVALIPIDGSIPDRLMKHADIALYRAKEEGRNTGRFFEPEMDARLQRRKALERELRLALSRDELALYYQPKVSLRNDEVAGVEALVRWQHPERGLVPPSEFIGVAEETGLILQLGEWVLRTACRQAAAWPGLEVSVNISPAQFRQPDLVQIVRSALQDSGLEPHRLELEVTESVLIQQPDAAAKLLDDLKALGVHVAMDDFGTGYSSLSYLQRFHFDKIKIDRSFIWAIGKEPTATAIVRAVINLADSLGMVTCAEGVETDEQLGALRHEGCSEVQGYLFGKPMPAAEFAHRYGIRANGSSRRVEALATAPA